MSSTSLVTISDKSPAKSSSLPRLLPAEQTTRDVAEFIGRYRAQCEEKERGGMTYSEHRLQVTESVLPEAAKHLAQLEKLSAPAPKVQIANHLAVLLKSFPNAGKDDGAELFGHWLCQDVGAHYPTIGGLEAACRQLRRTCRFIPTIAEVLTALNEVEEQQRKLISMLAGLPEQCKRIAASVAYDRERQAEWDREALESPEDREKRELLARRQRAGEVDHETGSPL